MTKKSPMKGQLLFAALFVLAQPLIFQAKDHLDPYRVTKRVVSDCRTYIRVNERIETQDNAGATTMETNRNNGLRKLCGSAR